VSDPNEIETGSEALVVPDSGGVASGRLVFHDQTVHQSAGHVEQIESCLQREGDKSKWSRQLILNEPLDR